MKYCLNYSAKGDNIIDQNFVAYEEEDKESLKSLGDKKINFSFNLLT